ncbi:MAG: family 10 glycosylhydrolase [Clostridia bacterium]|nr:family 10 glycosylhydrolase [Clostridia bacterium]
MRKKIVEFIPVMVSFAVLVACVVYFSFDKTDTTAVVKNTSDTETKSTVSKNEKSETVSKTVSEKDEEMRGIWIPYMSLDLSDTDRSEEQFRKKIDGIIQNCIKYKANTLIVQARPFGDSIYPSEYFPWSHIISGIQGKSVDYDPLNYIITQAHKNNLAVHVWVNPLRISTAKTPSPLSEDNPYMIWKNDKNTENDDYTFECDGGIYYNPAYAEVRKLIIDGVCEIVRNYDIDGVQFDDYFYPSEDTDYDKYSYEQYVNSLDKNSTPLSQQEWRTANINTLISGVYAAVHNIKNNVVFGTSPQGNIENDLKICADVYSWCSISGYVDYICPQIYVSNEHPVLPFNDTAKRWKNLVKNNKVRLYLGLGVYKAGTDADNGTWLLNDDNIKQQIEYSRNLKTDGFMLYSYEYLIADETQNEVQNAMAILE